MRPDQIPPLAPEQPRPRQSIDGVQLPPVRVQPYSQPVVDRQATVGVQSHPPRDPEYRYDHELPAPVQHQLLDSRHQDRIAANQQASSVPQSNVQPPIGPPLGEIDMNTPPAPGPKKPRSKLKMFLWSFFVLILLAVAGAGGVYVWYNDQLSPVTSDDQSAKVLVKIPDGTTPDSIAGLLKSESLIKSQTAFLAYLKISGKQNQLKAGAYSLQPNESTQQIVDHLVKGVNEEFDLTFLPGATLADHRKGLIKAGFDESEVDTALAAKYQGPLFNGKPETADLEGYIYGETYRFTADATVANVLQRTFDEYQKQAVAANLEAGFKKQGLTMFEGITLASIVQREVSATADMKQVAQVFYSRLNQGISLGSDVTYHYAADKAGVARSVDLDSPYNTRIYPGLPPGPIASPGLGALMATAYPATGDFLFFVSGDDDKTYFAKTNEEHNRNVALHCLKKCLLP